MVKLLRWKERVEGSWENRPGLQAGFQMVAMAYVTNRSDFGPDFSVCGCGIFIFHIFLLFQSCVFVAILLLAAEVWVKLDGWMVQSPLPWSREARYAGD